MQGLLVAVAASLLVGTGLIPQKPTVIIDETMPVEPYELHQTHDVKRFAPLGTKSEVVEQSAPVQPVASGLAKEDWMSQAGIPQSEWRYVDYIISKESGWNPQAINPSSGACGLAQQLPCGKWPHQWNDPVGALIDANNYAIQRYGSWAQAYNFWTANNWW